LERERQRQIQLAVKLDDMRQKKQVKKENFHRFLFRISLGLFGISKTNTFTTFG